MHVSAGMVAMNAPGGLFLLQRWSITWNLFVDVESVDDIKGQDRLTVVRAPSQEVKLKIIFLCLGLIDLIFTQKVQQDGPLKTA